MADYAFVQQGGSSHEFYLHVHDNLPSALRHAVSCEKATYQVTGIVELAEGVDLDELDRQVEGEIGYVGLDGAEGLLRKHAA
ncbi:hypothetical protein [Mycolicibacterium conceptionense]|nr:hypothetical protein [Mycolicibacterium conceptionense]